MAYLFDFKQKLQDFLVDEKLPFILKDEGVFLYIHIEKEKKTTMEIVDFLLKTYKLPKNAIGFAGLKDKHGITRQWFSFDADIVSRILRTKKFEKLLSIWLSWVCKVLKTGWYNQKLTTKDDLHNGFVIRLRSKKHKLSEQEREIVEWVLKDSLAMPSFPNYFGEQRFGVNGRNIYEGQRILNGYDKSITGFDRIFKLQAYTSDLFNQILERRISQGKAPIDGDLLLINKKIYLYYQDEIYLQSDRHQKGKFFIFTKFTSPQDFNSKVPYQIILPVLGFNSLIPHHEMFFGKWMYNFMKKNSITPENWKIYEELKIFWTLRTMQMSLKNPTWKWMDDDIILKFELEAGSYASVVVDQLLKTIKTKLDKIRLAKPVSSDPVILPQHRQTKKAKPHRKWKSKPKDKKVAKV
jgi:tRNA(Glu) U13 pseudouridine synthase TruD